MDQETHRYYDDPQTINYFNQILNGRWHTGLNCTTMGQIQMEELLVQKLKISSTDRVLDFGSGVGLVTCDLHLMTGCQITGLNISSKQVQLSRQLANHLKLKENQVKFVLNQNVTLLPFPDCSFDKIVFFESVCHVQDRAHLFQEFYRILKPGGLIGGQDWIQTDYCSLNPVMYTKYIRPICQTYKIPSLLSLNQFSQLLQTSKFQVIEMTDLDSVFAIGSSFYSHYFRELSVIGLITYIIMYIWSYLKLKLKYPQLQMKYSLKKINDPKLNLVCSGQVLNDAYINHTFSIGLILCQKL